MPLPTLIKSYEFDVNNVIAGDITQVGGPDDAHNDRKGLMLGVTRSMTNSDSAQFSSPWVVVGSCNAATFGLDGVNRWNAITDIVWVEGSIAFPPIAPHSWIVLRQPSLGLQLMIDCTGGSANGGAQIVAVASFQGFGAANGGTDGSLSTAPTAADQAVLRSGFPGSASGWSGNANVEARQFVFNVMASSDGEVWNLFAYHNDVLVMLWRFERPENSPGGWNTPVVMGMPGHGSDLLNADDGFIGQSMGLSFRASAMTAMDPARKTSVGMGQGVVQIHATTWGWGTVFPSRMGPTRFSVPNPLTGNFAMWPYWWYTHSTTMRGRVGRPFDAWLNTSFHGGPGDTIPSNPSTPEFVILSNADRGLILPWDGVTTPITL